MRASYAQQYERTASLFLKGEEEYVARWRAYLSSAPLWCERREREGVRGRDTFLGQEIVGPGRSLNYASGVGNGIRVCIRVKLSSGAKHSVKEAALYKCE